MMASMEEKIKIGGGMIVGAQTLAAEMKLLKEMQEHSGLLFHFPFFFIYFLNCVIQMTNALLL